ncbi:MAG: sigma-54-dependent Fis family transcriptional regulator [Candidatus Solibacter usitatus]|nr:sigma-54-dependent Fis family transcriptional regulator [Candidatus Solibacter usitatus]
MPKILIVEDDPSLRETMITFLRDCEGYEVDAAASTQEALTRLANETYPIVISDVYVDERTGLDILKAAKSGNPDCSVILMSGRGSMETVMEATRRGAFDYVAKPFELDQILEVVRRAEAAAIPSGDEDTEIDDMPETEMIGSSPSMIEVYKTISKAAPTDSTVLIQGETGTGKEMVARMIHNNSLRAQQPFVPVDCASIAASLLESELFGAMRGSYTGADRDRVGALEAANNGTVFLDEIGDIDHGFQLRLLRFLQEREVRPLGASRAKKVDVRVIAATNRDLAKMSEEKKFREDLYYRLAVVPITLPPLRDRRGDIPLLAHFFLRRASERYSLDARITGSGLRALQEHTWPGNVRQLQHLVERLAILAPQNRLDEEAVLDAIQSVSAKEAGAESLAETETEQIRKVLGATGGNKSRAAKILGIERKTLYRKLERMG